MIPYTGMTPQKEALRLGRVGEESRDGIGFVEVLSFSVLVIALICLPDPSGVLLVHVYALQFCCGTLL